MRLALVDVAFALTAAASAPSAIGAACAVSRPSSTPAPIDVPVAAAPPDSGAIAIGVAPAEPHPSSPARCDVRVIDVLEAQAFSGPPPDSPMRADAYRRLDPATRIHWQMRDHAMRHLRCTLRVAMNDAPYVYDHYVERVVGFGTPNPAELQPATCGTASTTKEVEARIRETTGGCADPHRGAYWGYDLRER